MRKLINFIASRFQAPTVTPGAGIVHLAEDRNGKRYTEHAFAFDGDPWQGATILSPRIIAGLREDGLLPLEEVQVDDQVVR